MGNNIVHVIGTGTIGEPLVGLLAVHREEFNIDEVTFHKNMPYSHDRPKLLQMIAKGANMATRKDRIEKFKAQGIEVAYEQEEAIARANGGNRLYAERHRHRQQERVLRQVSRQGTWVHRPGF